MHWRRLLIACFCSDWESELTFISCTQKKHITLDSALFSCVKLFPPKSKTTELGECKPQSVTGCPPCWWNVFPWQPLIKDAPVQHCRCKLQLCTWPLLHLGMRKIEQEMEWVDPAFCAPPPPMASQTAVKAQRVMPSQRRILFSSWHFAGLKLECVDNLITVYIRSIWGKALCRFIARPENCSY